MKFKTLKKPTLHLSTIDVFFNNAKNIRSKNDKNNKLREFIIIAIINRYVIPGFFKFDRKWQNLKNELESFINNLCEKKNIKLKKVKAVLAGGRRNHFDFKLLLNNKIGINVEFKFNAENVAQTPQFVSPMHPSKFLEICYAEFFYDIYLPKVLKKYDIDIPPKAVYLKCVNSPNPKALNEIQKKYYSGCSRSSKYTGNADDINFYDDMKKISHQSINDFISKFTIKKEKLTKYLLKSQENKIYMLYKNGKIFYQTVDMNEYIIEDVYGDPLKNRYIAHTKSGRQLKILLRWKNGNGVAYPSFQIS